MSIEVPIQTAFNAGRFTGRVVGRSDLEKYKYAAAEMLNFIPTVQGPAVKRSGTRYVTSCIATGSRSRLIPFEVSEEASYVLELGVNRIRVYQSGGAVLESPTIALSAAPSATSPVVLNTATHGLTTGDSVFVTNSAMEEINGRFFTVSVTSPTTFELLGEDGTGRATGTGGEFARHYDIVDGVASNSIPWQESELSFIQFVQSGDLMYLVHPDHYPHEIVRESATEWTCKEFEPSFPPLQTENVTDTTMYASAVTGTGITITASTSIFTADDVGRVLSLGEVVEAKNGKWTAGVDQDQLVEGTWNTSTQVYNEGRVYVGVVASSTKTGYTPPLHEEGTESDGNITWRFINWGWGYGTITAQTGTTCTLDVDTDGLELPASIVGSGNATKKWAFGSWDAVSKYPTAVAFYEDRLWFGGTNAEPQTFWGSASGDFFDFRITPATEDDTGLQFTLLSDQLNKISWMQGDEVLFMGTTGGEFTIDSGSAAKAITPSNVRVRRRSRYGTDSTIRAMSLDSSVIFIRRNSDVHEITFDFGSDRYVAPDLTQYADSILKPGVREVDYQADPFRQVWVLKTDGTLASLSFVKLEDVVAWADVEIGGVDAAVESIAVVPHPNGKEDQLWITVRRTVGGVTVRYVEYVHTYFDGDDIKDAVFCDSSLTYSGVPTVTIRGLWHLNGETVSILADGYRVSDRVVSDGAVTLTTLAETVTVGLPIPPAKLRTLPWGRESYGSTTHGRRGRIISVGIRVHELGEGLEYGGDFDSMDLWTLRDQSVPFNTPVPLYTGLSPNMESIPSGWGRDKQVAIRHSSPLPCTVVAILGELEVEDG